MFRSGRVLIEEPADCGTMPGSSQFRAPDTGALPLKEPFRGPSPCWRDDFKIIIMQTLAPVKATGNPTERLRKRAIIAVLLRVCSAPVRGGAHR
jgi:hypothetical protein